MVEGRERPQVDLGYEACRGAPGSKISLALVKQDERSFETRCDF